MINQFELFVTVVESGSYSSAARKLYKSPSAVSKQIAALEESLNVQLFDRTTRSLSLTEAGQLFFERCVDINQRINSATSELQSLTSSPSGDIAITWPPGLSYSEISNALAQFVELYPDIRINIIATNDVINIKEKGIDIAFRSSPKDSNELIGIQLFEVEPLVCASPSFIEKYGELESIDQLSSVPNIMPSYMNLVQKARPSFPAIAQLKLEEQHRSNDLPSIINLTKAGVGASFLFKHMVENELSEGVLQNLLPRVAVPKLPVYMIYSQTDHLPVRIRVFVDFFKQYFLHSTIVNE